MEICGVMVVGAEAPFGLDCFDFPCRELPILAIEVSAGRALCFVGAGGQAASHIVV